MTQNPEAHAEPSLLSGLSDLASRYDLILCDVWGVIHNGLIHHAGAVDALRRFRQGGGTVVLITNAPAPAQNVQARLDALNVPRDTFDAIATSGDVAIGMIVEAGCPPLFNLGPEREIALYQEAGRRGPRAPRLVGVQEAELVIAISLSEKIGPLPEDHDVLLRAMRARELTMICANPDIVVEVGDVLEYCAGALAERYEALGGVVVQAGKPFAPIYERALGLATEVRGRATAASRILAIGDAVHTDLRGARDQDYDAIFITGGIHRAELHGAAHGGPLDPVALRALLAARDVSPLAVQRALVWA